VSDSRGNARVPHAQTLDNAKRILQEAASVAPTIMLGPAPALDAVLVDDRVGKILGRSCAMRRRRTIAHDWNVVTPQPSEASSERYGAAGVR
jgi:hypothetical protein